MKIIDFTNYELSDRNLHYGGRAGEKRGILINGEFWFLKFPKNTLGMKRVAGLSYVTSPLSEFIGSNIYRILGYDVHETMLGICYDGKRYKPVCACKDFIVDDKNELLIPYTSLRNDTNPIIIERNEENIHSASNINEIIVQLEYNTILSKLDDAKKRFWDVAVIDMLINNNDRNEDNWGVIKNKITGECRLAPIYDCGNCFYGKTPEERIAEILSNYERLNSSAINGITAYEDDNERQISNIGLLQLNNPDLKDSINHIVKLVNEKEPEIIDFIKSIPCQYNDVLLFSDMRKDFYIKTLKIRIGLLKKAISVK